MNSKVLIGLIMGSALSVQATESIMTGSGLGFTDASCWSDPTGFVNPEYDYRVSGGTLKTDYGQNVSFVGHSLIIGDRNKNTYSTFALRTSSDLTHEFTGAGGLVLSYGGLDCYNACCTTLKGKVTVESTQDRPITMFASTSRSSKSTANIEFTGESFSGAETAFVHSYIKAAETAETHSSDVTIRILSDTSDYLGTYRVSAYRNEAIPSKPRYSTLQLGEHPFGGTIELRMGSQLQEVTAGYSLKIASLSITNNSILALNWDSVNDCGATYEVTKSLKICGPVEIRPTGSTTISTEKAMRHALLKAPKGTKLNVSDFKYVAATARSTPTLEKNLPNVELEVADDDEGLSTLYVSSRQVITLLKDDSSSVRSFSQDGTKPTNWSNDDYPSSTYDYKVTGLALRTGSSSTFNGHSLTLAGGGSQMTMCLSANISVNDLRMDVSKHNVVFDNYGGTKKVSGNAYVGPSNNNAAIFYVYCADGRSTWFQSDLCGTGNLCVRLTGTSSQSYSSSYVKITGDNSNWKGKLIIDQNRDAPAGRSALQFVAANNLGGPLDAFAYDAVTLSARAVLTPMTDGIVLNEPTRGVYALSGSSINVTNDLVFTLQQRLTYEGGLNKIGTGRLRLGGEAPRFTSAQLAEPIKIEGAETNVLNIAGGSLTPLSATAFEGLDVRFASGTAIVLEHPSALSADAARYGMRLTHELSSLAIADATIPVSLAATTSTKCGLTAICTLPAAKKDAFKNRFVLTSETPYGDDRYARLVTLDNSDGTVTFAVRIVRGLHLLFM